MGVPVTGGHKYRDLALQDGGLNSMLMTLLSKKNTVLKSKVKIGWYKSGRIF
jgi:hypothetical protein